VASPRHVDDLGRLGIRKAHHVHQVHHLAMALRDGSQRPSYDRVELLAHHELLRRGGGLGIVIGTYCSEASWGARPPSGGSS
jgi:hypothetical protein